MKFRDSCDVCFQKGFLTEKCCSFNTCCKCFDKLTNKNCPQCNKIITEKIGYGPKIFIYLKIVLLIILFILLIPINIIWVIVTSILSVLVFIILVIIEVITFRVINFDDTELLFNSFVEFVYRLMKNIKKKIKNLIKDLK